MRRLDADGAAALLLRRGARVGLLAAIGAGGRAVRAVLRFRRVQEDLEAGDRVQLRRLLVHFAYTREKQKTIFID